MPATHCPICATELEVQTVAPCADCGDQPGALEECASGQHYSEYRAFGEIPLILCDFCHADFGGYYADYFGGTGEGLIPENTLTLLHEIDPATQPREDGVCPACEKRLAFLDFRAAAIAQHARQRNA